MNRFPTLALLLLVAASPAFAADLSLFSRTNLVAWCVVPFDAKQRGPAERAEMLAGLGIRKLAYDWRDHHIPTFDQEVLAMKEQGIELTAWWAPGALNDTSRKILEVIERHRIKPQLWVLIGEPLPGSNDTPAKVRAAAAELRPLVEAAGRIGCKVALYNHGGWFGEPENQLAILDELNLPNAGLVYNFHHGHDHIERFPELIALMKPRLLALNLNGMLLGGDRAGHKILHIGEGDRELDMLKAVLASGWRGPVGILDHRDETDSEVTLRKNLLGLEYLIREIEAPGSGGTRPFPIPETRRPASAAPARGGLGELPAAFGSPLREGMVLPGSPRFASDIALECWARLRSSAGFNILVAHEEKTSPNHWEIYSYAGTGELSVFLPGRGGEFKTGVNICDNRWHHITMILGARSLQLFLNGEKILEAPIAAPHPADPQPSLAFARLVEGGIGCDGLLDHIRISHKARNFAGLPKAPSIRDESTLGLWEFDEFSDPEQQAAARDFWLPEDPAAREALPEIQVIPAATADELTPAISPSPLGSGANWTRSHGDNGSTRFSRLDQIHRGNVAKLEIAWTYHSGDGEGNIQSNPVIVDGVIYVPTVGHHVVAIDGATGKELWRFKPEGRPAHRGLVYWPGTETVPPRLIFPSGKWLYALDPATGRPVPGFGRAGRIDSGESVVAPAIFENVLVVPGFHQDVFGFDVISGQRLWTFHTIPRPGEFGADTWSQPGTGANCWGGMALDDQRGIAYFSTGSPKPNFTGIHHRGDNLFANSIIALDVKTGQRLWHFQEIRHDIWDLDIPAPPNLVTVRHQGRLVDAVAQVTKLGNTLLLDRVTGKSLFPFRLRRAPVSTLPGERTAPYQPDPELPEPFAKQTFDLAHVTDRTPEAREFVLNQLHNANFGWFEPFQEGKPTVLYGIHGGAEWTGAAVDPQAGRLYVSANEIPWIITVYRTDDLPSDPALPPTPGRQLYEAACSACHGFNREGVGVSPPLQGLSHRMDDAAVTEILLHGRNAMPAAPPMTPAEHQALLDYLFRRDQPHLKPPPDAPPNFTHNGYPKLLDHEGYPGTQPPWGTLNCLDLNTGKLLWQVPLGEYPELTAEGMPLTGTENFGGPMLTAGGLVFCAGTRDEKIRAFDSDTGRELWSHKLPWGGYAPPATYQAGGRQFIIIPATGGGKLGGPMGDAYVAFALPLR